MGEEDKKRLEDFMQLWVPLSRSREQLAALAPWQKFREWVTKSMRRVVQQRKKWSPARMPVSVCLYVLYSMLVRVGVYVCSYRILVCVCVCLCTRFEGGKNSLNYEGEISLRSTEAVTLSSEHFTPYLGIIDRPTFPQPVSRYLLQAFYLRTRANSHIHWHTI